MPGRPCVCDRFTPGEPYVKGRDCAACFAYHHHPALRRAWGGGGEPAAVSVVARPLPSLRPACADEGPVVESCKGCGNKPARHVRTCYHADNPTETCTRGVVSGLVWSCATCPHHRPAG